MTPQQIVGLAARLFAIWLVIIALPAVTFSQILHSEGNQASAPVPYFIASLYLGTALVLWFFPMFVAHTLVPRTRFEETLRLPSQQVVVVACVVLGLFVVVIRALPAISVYFSVAAYWIARGERLSVLEARHHIDGLVGFTQLAAGMLLMTKAHILADKLVPSFRTDHDHPEHP